MIKYILSFIFILFSNFLFAQTDPKGAFSAISDNNYWHYVHQLFQIQEAFGKHDPNVIENICSQNFLNKKEELDALKNYVSTSQIDFGQRKDICKITYQIEDNNEQFIGDLSVQFGFDKNSRKWAVLKAWRKGAELQTDFLKNQSFESLDIIGFFGQFQISYNEKFDKEESISEVKEASIDIFAPLFNDKSENIGEAVLGLKYFSIKNTVAKKARSGWLLNEFRKQETINQLSFKGLATDIYAKERWNKNPNPSSKFEIVSFQCGIPDQDDGAVNLVMILSKEIEKDNKGFEYLSVQVGKFEQENVGTMEENTLNFDLGNFFSVKSSPDLKNDCQEFLKSIRPNNNQLPLTLSKFKGISIHLSVKDKKRMYLQFKR